MRALKGGREWEEDCPFLPFVFAPFSLTSSLPLLISLSPLLSARGKKGGRKDGRAIDLFVGGRRVC